ncbi:outmembrane protein of unknown function [Shewanella benthica]|uniref:DUF1554 domain-containing protein n=1 Tax=Shewanella benthica TaxID=43661 RepID=A0A330M9V4_9GAMM|nr:hypothetical protein [Shewanella benthica]SQH78204.1 outmembrane protein of unknown function [Shewanella benthica]
MKAIKISTLALLIASSMVNAAEFNQAGTLLDSNTELPIDGTLPVTFTIYDGEQAVWTNDRILDFVNGEYSLVLGQKKSIEDKTFASSELTLGINVDNDGEMMPRLKLSTAPRAYFAEVAGSIKGQVDLESLAINEQIVIDENGQWVGDPTGLVGRSGIDGLDGVSGEPGAQGATGAAGATGEVGAQGATGEVGAQGAAGAAGATGEMGAQGQMGAAGINGTNGANGVDGTNGANGVDGNNGASAYLIWLDAGNSGTEADFLASLNAQAGTSTADTLYQTWLVDNRLTDDAATFQRFQKESVFGVGYNETMFLTTVLYDGSINGGGGITAANTACQTEANSTSSIVPTGTYKAVLWSSSQDLEDETSVFSSSYIGYTNAHGALIARNFKDLQNDLLAPIDTLVDGSRKYAQKGYWRGSMAQHNCSDWTSNSAGVGYNGASYSTSGINSTSGATACSQKRHLLCVRNF